ncbi:MAG: glycosyltransferase family A protein [Candidatus Omnitrophica bacterium]|nr:glycosyltransferase family A protein [Candidatus Omnitrophota bacterium]MDD5553688.1 glycosyltransferase family A protein [Candidatus Omnitrophota bacterium]
MRVSVVIPTCKRNNLLKRCLKSVAEQRFSRDEYEVIVADDGANPETRATILYFALAYIFMKFKYVPVEGNHGPAAARNAGWKQAEADIIAFIDDDCVAEPDWLSAGMASFSPEIAAVSGVVKVPVSQKPRDYELCIARMQECRFLTANCFYRKSVLKETGGFDENFKTAWREDSDLYFTVLSRRLPVGLAEDSVVTHHVRNIPWGMGIKEEKKNLYNALLFKKHPWFFRKFIEHSPPWFYYLTVSSALTGILGLLFFPALKGFILLWVFMSLMFAVKRLSRTSKSLSHVLEMVFTSFLIPFLSVFWRIAGALRFGIIYF